MGSKVKGVDIYVSIWTGSWTKLGGQKDITIDRGASSIETTDKNSDGWEERMAGIKNWGLSFDAFLIEDSDDPGFVQFETDFEAGNLNNFRITTPKHTYTGYALIEGLTFNGPLSDVSSISFTLKGSGALNKG